MSNILTGFNMQGNDPIDNRIVSPSKFETLEEYLQRVPIQKRYYGLSFYALDENNELRHYTFQTSLIEPTIDDDEEEIERLDKELQEHVNNKEIHKTSEEIRSEIVDADIPDTIARVQWTLDKIEEAVNTVMGDIVDGASDEYNTLKKIQDKIVELRTEVESQLYGDDGGEVLKTLEQALKFLNQYKDFIVDIPDNYVNKQDIVDNLNTDDPTKVLSARQGKVLSETLTNYFDSAMASIRAETNRATNAENRIEAKLDSEIDRSTAEDIRIQSELDAEEARAQSEEKRIEGKLDAEIERSTTKDTELGNQIIAETNRAEGEEQRIETKLDNEITRSTAKDADHDSRIEALEGETHVQNTDIGTTSQTFQLQMGKPGNKIKNEDAAISVRNADDSDYANFIAKNATFKGDLIVEGQSFVTEAETVEIKDNILLLNKGEAGSGVTKGMAGLQIDRGTEPDFQILFVESDRRFKAGEEGNLQCLALRDEDGDMLDGMFTTWDSATHRLKTTNIIPSTRKLFFNTNANSLGYTSHVYDSTYTADSFTFTKEAGSLFFSAGTTNLNLDTDKTYFRFYKNLMIPSSIISSGTSISLLNASGATIATFGSPSTINSTINSTLNVANQVIIKGGSDVKLIIQSADADNFNLIESQNSSGTKLSTFGYYGTFWGIDGYDIATKSWSNNKFLPLAGGTMTGVILMDNNVVIQSKNSSGTAKRLIGKGSDNVTYIGDSDGNTFLYSDAADIIHVRNGTNYTIYDSYNFNPGNYLPLTGGTLSGNLTINTVGSTTFVINNNDTNGSETFMRVLRKGTASAAIGFRDSLGAYIYNYNSKKYLFIDNDGYARVGTTSGSTRLALITDIPSISGYLPLSGGTMSGNISFNGDTGHIVVGAREISNYVSAVSFNKGSATNSALIGYHSTGGSDSSGALILVPYSTSANPWAKTVGLYIAKNELLLDGKAIATQEYVTWNNVAGKPTIYERTIGINGTYWSFYAPTNATSAMIYGPTSAGTSGQILQSTGGVPTWSNISSVGDSRYVLKSGDTMTGNLSLPYLTSTQPVSGWTSEKVPNDYRPKSFYLEDDYKGGSGISNYGTVVTFSGRSAHWVNQMRFAGGTSTLLAVRTCDYNSKSETLRKFTDWEILASQKYVDSKAAGYLPLTGGTLTGALTISLSSVAPIILNNTNASATEISQTLRIGGTSKGYFGYTTSTGVFMQNSDSSIICVKSNGAYYGTSTNTLTKLLTSADLSSYATQTWVNNKNYAVRESDNVLISHSNEFNFTASSNTFIAINYRGGSGSNTSAAITDYRFYNGQGSYSNVNLVANSFTGSLIGNATTATTATKLGSSTIGGTAKPIYLSSGTATACSATVGSSTVPVYMSSGTITQCSTTLGVSITGNAATATTASNSNNLGGYAAATYVKSTSTTKVSDIQVVTTAGSTTGVLYVVLES